MASPTAANKKPRAPRISRSDWDEYRKVIEQLYVQKGKSLEKVAASLSQHYGFEAQKCQYKAQMKRWGFRKNSRSSRSEGEHELSFEPSKEQQEYWIS
jgi:hypothetical protein